MYATDDIEPLPNKATVDALPYDINIFVYLVDPPGSS